MYRLVTKYTLLGLRPDSETVGHMHNLMLRPIAGTPHDFDTEQAAIDWALGNHDDMRHHREFVVLPVHHMVLSDS